MADTRKDKRAPVSLKVRFKSATVDQFIEQYSIDVSRGGLFIKSKSPMPVGTLLKFEFQLKDESRFIQGVGRVVWMRMPEQSSEPDRPPGMGVKFIKMDPQSRALVERIVAPRGERPAAYESGTADAAPPPPRPGSSWQPNAAVQDSADTPFFPSTTPEHELPPLEDRTQVRHASQFLASAVLQAGVDPSVAEQAEQEAWRARRRTGELERQRAVAASLSSEPRMDSARPTERPPERDNVANKGKRTMAYEDYGGLFGSGPPAPAESSEGMFEDATTGLHGASRPPTSAPPQTYSSMASASTERPAAVVSKRPSARVSAETTSNWKPVVIVMCVMAAVLGGIWWWQTQSIKALPSIAGMNASQGGSQAQVTQRTSQVNAPKEPTSGPATSPSAVAPPSAQTVSVHVSSDPSGATVMQDGVEVGQTPVTLRLAPAGTSTLNVKAPGFAAATRQLSADTIRGPVHIKLPPLVYLLEVVTVPAGGEVTVLGQNKRAPTMFTLGVVKNNFIVRAEKAGFVVAERVVMLDDFAERGGQMRYRLVLELKVRTGQPAHPPTTPEPPATEPGSPPSGGETTPAPTPSTPPPPAASPEPVKPEPAVPPASKSDPPAASKPAPAPPPTQNPDLPTNPF